MLFKQRIAHEWSLRVEAGISILYRKHLIDEAIKFKFPLKKVVK